MDKRNRLLLLTFLVQLVLNLLAKGNTEPEPIVVISNEEEQVIDESEQPGIITETQSEDSEAVKDILPQSPKRVRRQILFSGGGFGSLPNSGSQALQTDFSVTQNCDGVTIHWKKYNLPYSSEYKYDHKQSDFKYYNIYRSTSYFDDVTSTTMKPYKSGRNELLLRMVQTDTWTDMFPPTNKPLYYAVTYVQGNGNEIMLGKSQKVIFYGAIEKQGRLFPLIPKILRGKALHHSVTYNPTLDHYLVAFDWDQNNDGRPDHLYAMRLDYQGRIVGRNILNFTATVPGWIGGEQGWPSVTYNQRTDEFFVLFHFRSLRHFGNVHVILGQRILTRSRLTARARSPILVAKATSNNGWRKVPISHPTVIYNPKTGGYAATAVISNPRKEVHVLFLNSLGKMSSGKSVFSFSTNAYEPNLWWDSKREEIYFTCQISREAAVGTADFKLQPGQYLVVATKMNATGAHAANSPTQSTKQFVGYTDKRHANIQGYYNPRLDRLVLFWENFKNGRNTISTTSILLTRQRYTRDENKWYNCPIQREVRSPVVTYMETSGSHYMIWEEKTNQVWSIGGYKLQGNMNRRNREQRNPAVVFNTRRKSLFVVFQEVLNGQNVYLFGQHVRVAASFSCTKGCGFNEKCVQQDVCISKNSNPCFVKNGGCSHFCSFTAKKGVSCSCPVDMELSKDFMTCIPLRPCKGQAPLKDASGSDLSCSRGFRKNSCPKGSYCQVLSGKCCPAVLPGYSLYLATVGDIWEFKARPSSSRASFTRIPISRGFNIVALSYDPVDKRVYWSDVQTRKISRAFLNGQGEHAIVDTNLVVPDGLALDTIDRKIYWTDAGTKKIERADMDGSNRASILTLNASENPRAIVLYRANRFLFWTNWGQVPKISRASFDGTNVVVLVNSNLGWPNGIVIDEPAKRIYWADAKTDKLESCDFNGNRRKTYVTKVSHPFGLALLNERIFWSDWETGAIHSADKNTGTATKILVEGLQRPMGIFIHKDNSGIPCSDPGIPLNGGRNPKPNKNGKYKSGTKILFTCHPDYNLVGFGSTICRKSGKWSKVRPKCIAPPVFTSRPQNQTVDEGAYVVLKCKASNRYTTIKWIKNGKIIPSSGPNHLILSGSLILLKIFYEEKGFYTCEISNKAGVKTATVYLKVRGSQKIPCGVARFKRRGRIIGGHQVTKGSHPWQAMLWDKSKKKHFCGGSLITDKWVVTAAHCVTGNIFPSDIRVRLGKHIRTKVENFTEQSSDAKSVKTHPHYNSRTFDSDLALIELKDRVVFTDYVQPICLPSSKTDFSLFKNNATGTITGWGQKKKRRRSNKLQEVTIPVVSQATCKKAYQSYHITGNMFCAGQTNGGRDACQGDSGGPFSIENPKTKRTVLIGVISWGEGCGTKGKYGVYTRIYNFVDWIFNEIRNN